MASTRVEIRPELLLWACERAGDGAAALREKYSVQEWISGEKKPTLKQIEDFARAARVPMGYLFVEHRPILIIRDPDTL